MAVREYYITEDIMWFSEKEKWEGLKSIGMVHKVMKKNNGEQTDVKKPVFASQKNKVMKT